MAIELLYDLLAEVSPMYFYLSIILSMVFTFRMVDINVSSTMMANQKYTKEYHALAFKRLPIDDAREDSHDVQDWITHTTKRIDVPDDDGDNHSFSFYPSKQKRGGSQWDKNLYSLSLESIALL